MPAEGLPAANSLAQASQVIGGLIGAGMAGVLFGVFGSGLIGFAIDSATFVISFLLISRISRSAGAIDRSPGVTRRDGVGASVLEGLRIIRGSRVLLGIVMAVGVTMLGLGAVNVLFVPLVVNDLQVSPTWMAGIDGAQTAGMLVAAALVTTLARRLSPTTIISLGLLGIGVSIGLVSGVREIWQVLPILLAVGLFVTPLQAMVQTIVQTSTRDATRGRVVSVVQAAMSTASVTSMAIGGVLGAIIDIRAVFLAAGIVVVLAAGLSALMFRGISGRPAPSELTAEPEAA